MAEQIKVRSTFTGDVVEVKSLMIHPMETGTRRDPDTGELVPLHHIIQVTFEHEDRTVMIADWGPGISKNPFFSFSFKGATPGDKLTVSWLDNKGETASLETELS